MQIDGLTGSLPSWVFSRSVMSRFLRANSDVWTPRPDVGPANPSIAQSHSQEYEESYAYNNFFYGRGGGTFLEMGALDGVTYANTYALEHVLGWKGILVEASPSSFKLLKDNRPGQVTLHVAVCETPTVVHYADAYDPCCRGIAEFMALEFLLLRHPEVPGGTDFSALPTVRCEPLPTILGTFGVQHINFFSLDVEGGELSILRAIDFSLVSFDVLVIEADGLNKEKDKAVIDLLGTKGYKYHGHVTNTRNDWFVREGFNASRAPTA